MSTLHRSVSRSIRRLRKGLQYSFLISWVRTFSAITCAFGWKFAGYSRSCRSQGAFAVRELSVRARKIGSIIAMIHDIAGPTDWRSTRRSRQLGPVRAAKASNRLLGIRRAQPKEISGVVQYIRVAPELSSKRSGWSLPRRCTLIIYSAIRLPPPLLIWRSRSGSSAEPVGAPQVSAFHGWPGT
jgi:hypothetical protein